MRINRNVWTLAIAAAAMLLAQGSALAQHSHTMGITSDADGSGELLLNWNFDGLPIARATDSGLAGVFTGNVPGFNDATGNGVDTFTLHTPAEMSVEAMAMDDGLRWIFQTTPSLDDIAGAGDTAFINTMPNLHNHATFELTTVDAYTFAEGEISFRVFESTASPFGYTPSEVRTLTVSNGYLSPMETATKEAVNCQKAVAGGVRGFSAKTYQLIGQCMDAVLAHTLLEKPAKPALKKCSLDELDEKSLVGKIADVKAKTIEKLSKKCGPLNDSSVPYTQSQIHTHFGMAQCRAEELAGATYNRAATQIGGVLEAAGEGDEHDVEHAFPCMKASFD